MTPNAAVFSGRTLRYPARRGFIVKWRACAAPAMPGHGPLQLLRRQTHTIHRALHGSDAGLARHLTEDSVSSEAHVANAPHEGLVSLSVEDMAVPKIHDVGRILIAGDNRARKKVPV